MNKRKGYKYETLYQMVRAGGYEPGNVVWQRNRWRLRVTGNDGKERLLASTGKKEQYEAFFEKVRKWL